MKSDSGDRAAAGLVQTIPITSYFGLPFLFCKDNQHQHVVIKNMPISLEGSEYNIIFPSNLTPVIIGLRHMYSTHVRMLGIVGS